MPIYVPGLDLDDGSLQVQHLTLRRLKLSLQLHHACHLPGEGDGKGRVMYDVWGQGECA